jgi:hypothetical protein
MEKQPLGVKLTPHKFWLACAKLAILLGVAFFVYGSMAIKTTIRLQPTKQGVDVEVAHTPSADVRWIYISGNSEVFTSGSLIQSDGTDCAIIHRLKWRVPKVGTLEVRVDIRDSQNQIIETVFKTIILGFPPESGGA